MDAVADVQKVIFGNDLNGVDSVPDLADASEDDDVPSALKKLHNGVTLKILNATVTISKLRSMLVVTCRELSTARAP